MNRDTLELIIQCRNSAKGVKNEILNNHNLKYEDEDLYWKAIFTVSGGDIDKVSARNDAMAGRAPSDAYLNEMVDWVMENSDDLKISHIRELKSCLYYFNREDIILDRISSLCETLGDFCSTPFFDITIKQDPNETDYLYRKSNEVLDLYIRNLDRFIFPFDVYKSKDEYPYIKNNFCINDRIRKSEYHPILTDIVTDSERAELIERNLSNIGNSILGDLNQQRSYFSALSELYFYDVLNKSKIDFRTEVEVSSSNEKDCDFYFNYNGEEFYIEETTRGFPQTAPTTINQTTEFQNLMSSGSVESWPVNNPDKMKNKIVSKFISKFKDFDRGKSHNFILLSCFWHDMIDQKDIQTFMQDPRNIQRSSIGESTRSNWLENFFYQDIDGVIAYDRKADREFVLIPNLLTLDSDRLSLYCRILEEFSESNDYFTFSLRLGKYTVE